MSVENLCIAIQLHISLKLLEPLFPLFRNEIPRPSWERFKTFYPILAEIFGFVIALPTNPHPKFETIKSDMPYGNPCIAIQVRIGLKLFEPLFPFFRKGIPTPSRERFKTLYLILAKKIFGFARALGTNPRRKV